MTLGALFWAGRRSYLFMCLIFGLLAWAVYSRHGSTGAAFVAVAFFTALLRDVGYFLRAVRVWPITREFIDWSKVEAALAEEEDLMA